MLAEKEARRARRNRAAYAARVVASIGEGGTVSRGSIILSEMTGRPYTQDNFSHLFADIRVQAAARRPDVTGH